MATLKASYLDHPLSTGEEQRCRQCAWGALRGQETSEGGEGAGQGELGGVFQAEGTQVQRPQVCRKDIGKIGSDGERRRR